MKRRAFAMLVAALCLGSGCAGNRRIAELPPFSTTVSAWLAWDAATNPKYQIAVSLPLHELDARAGKDDALIRLILNASITSGSGKAMRREAWTREIERAQLVPARASQGRAGAVDWFVELGTVAGSQELALSVLAQGQPFGVPWRRSFRVPALEPDALFLGEPVFLGPAESSRRPGVETVGDSSDARILVERYYAANSGAPRLRAAVYDFAPAVPVDVYELTWVLSSLEDPDNETGQEVLRRVESLVRTGPITLFDVTLPAALFGRHAVALRASVHGRSATAEGRFEVGLEDLAALGAHDGGLDLLRLLMSTSEVDSLRLAAPEAREGLWDEFWRRRDPDPSTPENEARDVLLSRVRHANETFGGARSGWRTDRGQVFVRRGAPDRIDVVQNPEGFDRIERWTYATDNVVFVFIDREGRGDYTLLRTNAPD